MSDFPAVRFRDYAGLVAAMRAVKDHIGLSNSELESICGLTAGHVDKALGPSAVKTIGRSTFDLLCGGLAIEFQVYVDLEAARRMESRWERRNRSQIRTIAKPLSHIVLEQAKAAIFSELGRKGGIARRDKISKRRRREIAREAGKKGARVRWRAEREDDGARRAAERAAQVLKSGAAAYDGGVLTMLDGIVEEASAARMATDRTTGERRGSKIGRFIKPAWVSPRSERGELRRRQSSAVAKGPRKQKPDARAIASCGARRQIKP